MQRRKFMKIAAGTGIGAIVAGNFQVMKNL
jgi:hypothetical protein